MTRTLSLSGFEFSFQFTGRDTGELPPVLFLSGAFQTMRSWRRFETVFGQRTRVVLVDLPGAGESAVLPPKYGLDFLADAVAHVLDAAGLDRVVIVSSSYGSPVAYRFAQKNPKRVSSLVLAGVMRSISDGKRESITRTLQLFEGGRLDDFAQLAVRSLLCCDAKKRVDRRRVAERVLLRGLSGMEADARARYITNSERLLRHAPLDLTRPPKSPSLVFTGEHDVFTTAPECRDVARQLGAWFTTIRHADHLFHIEQFETTVDLLMRFAEGRMVARVPGCTRVERFRSPHRPRTTAA